MDIMNLIEREGAKNLRFVVPMRKFERVYFGLIRAYTSDQYENHNCIITENPKLTRYKIEDNYKITLMSLDDMQIEHYYVGDLNSLIHHGNIKVDVKPAFLDVV